MSVRQALINRSISVNGQTFTEGVEVDYDNSVDSVVDLEAAKEGSITVRTDANTGTLVLAADHGVITADKICIFWDDDEDTLAEKGARSNVTVGTVAGTTVPIDLGDGDDLPPVGTPVRVMVLHSETYNVTDPEIDPVFIVGTCTTRGFIIFAQTDGTPIVTAEIDGENGGSYVWTEESGAASPFGTSDVAKVLTAHGDPDNTRRLAAYTGYNN
jgi:hypothetical protein